MQKKNPEQQQAEKDPRKVRFVKKRLYQILFLLLLAIPPTYLLVIYQQSSRVMYFGPDYEYWVARKKARCTQSKKKYIYADMRPGQTNPLKPLELSCEAALKLPQSHHYATTAMGVKIHYVRYQSQSINPQAPILLYIPGITGNDMTGARFYPMAERLGFELVVMEPSNHGTSDDNGTGGAYGCREKEDILAVFETLLKNDPKRQVLMAGTSMGALIILNAADKLAQSPYYKQLIATALENPPSSLRAMLIKVGKEENLPLFLVDHVMQMAQWRTGYDFDDCSGLEYAARLRVPSLVQTSAKDSLVPPWMAQQVYQALSPGLPHQYKLYPHGRHSAVWNGQPEIYEQDLQNFWNQARSFQQGINSNS